MNWRLALPMAIVVLAVWLVGAAVTKFSLGQMAIYTPVAMLVVGATAALVLLWVKVVLQLVRGRQERSDST
jgi:hypothetical protein